MCYAWSLSLMNVLRKRGQKVQFVGGRFQTDRVGKQGHYWLVTSGFIVDITASQFNHLCEKKLPQIAILPHPDDRYIESR